MSTAQSETGHLKFVPRLTRRQVETLLAIRNFIRLRGFPASTEQLAGELGVSLTTAGHRVEALMRKGLVERPLDTQDRYRKALLTTYGGAVAALHGKHRGKLYRFVAPVREGDRAVFPREASR